MQSLFWLFALATATFPFFACAVPFSATVAGQVVPGKWIVTLQPDADVATVVSHFAKVREIQARNVGGAPQESGTIERQYGFGRFKGYAGSFGEAAIEELRGLPEVAIAHSLHAAMESDMVIGPEGRRRHCYDYL